MSMVNMELYDALLSVNVPEMKARKVAESILGHEQVATKADIAEIKADIHVLKMDGRRKYGTDTGPDFSGHGLTGINSIIPR